TSIDPLPEAGIGIQPRPRPGAIIRQPLQTEEDGVGQGLGQAQRQPCLAAAQRTDDVVQRPDVVELERFATPGPGKVKGNAELGCWPQNTGKLSGGWRLTTGQAGPKIAYLLDSSDELADAIVERRLMRCQGGFQVVGVASQHTRHLSETEAE